MKLIQCTFPIFILSLAGCGSGNSDDSTYLSDYYTEREGDRIVHVTTAELVLSDGRIAEYTNEDVKTYIQVESIPEKYGYSGDIEGPYILEVTTQNGVLHSHEYRSLEKERIIDDDFEKFESIEYTSWRGTDEVENVQIGGSYDFYKNATRFNSTTGLNVGSVVSNMTINIANLETISVLAGTFNSLKLDFTLELEINEIDQSGFAEGSGSVWVDVDQGIMLKMIQDDHFSYSWTPITADGIIEVELKSLSITEEDPIIASKSRSLKSGPLDMSLDLNTISREIEASLGLNK